MTPFAGLSPVHVLVRPMVGEEHTVASLIAGVLAIATPITELAPAFRSAIAAADNDAPVVTTSSTRHTEPLKRRLAVKLTSLRDCADRPVCA